jgi:capsular polysaccharide biosynthesis protein
MRFSNVINFLNPAAPKGLIPSADDWVQQRVLRAGQLRKPQPAAWVREVFPEEENIHLLQYPTQPTPFNEFSSVRWTASPAASLFYLQGCRILGGEGAVISPDNRVFADFTLPPADRWLEHACFRRRRIPPVTRLKGWYATIVWPESHFFFHWMIEALPRMAVLGDYARLLDGLFVPSPLQEFHRESLRLLGIDSAKLIPVDVGSHFQPERLLVPRTFAMYNPPRWLHSWFKGAYLPSATEHRSSAHPIKRIYVSRNDAPARRVENEDEVLQHLAPLGFVAVRLSELSMAEQARVFNEAEVIVAPHGAGLSNLVFCKEKTIVVEILPPRWMAPCFMALASCAGCIYRHLLAQETPVAGPARPQFDNVKVPVQELAEILAGFQIA